MGKIATDILASGKGWKASHVVCTAGPHDRPFEEQHNSVSIAVVVEGTFRYRSRHGSDIMSLGSILLDNEGQSFECSHEHGTGDRCVAFQYAAEFFERAGAEAIFPVHRIPPMAALAPWVAQSRFAINASGQALFDELAHGLADKVLEVVGHRGRSNSASASDERRISAVLRFIQACLGEPLPLERLASTAGMSEFHFLRVFKQVTQVTPHQYILRARLSEAALRLTTHSDPVIEIALESGFPDLSNFNHAFRREFGMNPARFRSAHGRASPCPDSAVRKSSGKPQAAGHRSHAWDYLG